MSCIFFFQAEDGIRDWSVTGVQTCALPISINYRDVQRAIQALYQSGQFDDVAMTQARSPSGKSVLVIHVKERSEERRVGKGLDLGVCRDEKKIRVDVHCVGRRLGSRMRQDA